VLAGRNLAAIGDGSADNWELFQFASAQLVDLNTWDLSERLRGRFGSNALMPDAWPEGSRFVLLNVLPKQLDLAMHHKGLERHYRIGPAKRGYDDPSFKHYIETFRGNALRPYAPCHLRLSTGLTGDLSFTWTRRTRVAGDEWAGNDVALGEEKELYQVQAKSNGVVVREEVTSNASWTYPLEEQASDTFIGHKTLHVAQVSAVYGPGVFSAITV
jgi:hypothetical protein